MSGFRPLDRYTGMNPTNLRIRRANPHDAPALCRLAALDSAEPLGGEILLAEVEGEAAAALSLADGTAIADPFRPTAALVELLAMRRTQLAAARSPARGRLRRWAPQLAR
jgi:hypothetical protein